MAVDPTTLAKERLTSLGLYVTAKEAYDLWQADPEGVRILDVRTPEEFVFVGHAPMAWNIPLALPELRVGPRQAGLPLGPQPRLPARGAGVGRHR